VGSVTNQQALVTYLTDKFSEQRAREMAQAIPTNQPITSLLQFYILSRMSADEFMQVEPDLTVSTNSFQEGLINVNTASEAVLACVPGIGWKKPGAS